METATKQETLKDRFVSAFIKFSKIVTSTMGPYGRNVLIRKSNGMHHSTKDGVTVANDLSSEDEIEQMACDMIKEVANLTAEQVGDGTTTSICLASSLLESIQRLDEDSYNVHELREEIINESEIVIKNLINNSHKEINEFAIKSVAGIASNGNKEIVTILSDIFSQTNGDATVNVKKWIGDKIKYEVIDGYKMNSGYAHPAMITDKLKNEVYYQDSVLFSTNLLIGSAHNLKSILDAASTFHSSIESLVIVCDVIEDSAIGFAVDLIQKTNLKITIIKAPEMGVHRKNIIEDVALLSGAKKIAMIENGSTLSNLTKDHFGKCKSFLATKNTSVFSIEQRTEDVENKIRQLEIDKENSANDILRQQISNRINSLKGKIANIFVGKPSEVETKELKDRMDDAVASVKSLYVHGYTIGCGFSFFNAITHSADSNGRIILNNALMSVTQQIFENRGFYGIELAFRDGAKSSYRDLKDTEKIHSEKSLLSHGIIDSTEVLVRAIRNAVSVVGTILVTKHIIKGYVEDDLFKQR